MKTLKNIHFATTTFLAVVLLVFSPKAWAQPTVQVPASCNVVVAGSGPGVSTGYGGVVGNGGIVIIKDPSAPDSYFLIPNGTTVTGWSLAGDLSFDTPNTPPAPALQSIPGAASPVKIMPYNENLRPSEMTHPTLARSKGRVRLSYVNPPCSGAITFDVYKEYNTSTYVPPIIGPDCWLADTVYTYSVDQIASDNLLDAIGLDQYYWTIVDGSGNVVTNNVYTSADKSSITVQAPSTLVLPYTITCCFGRANPWDANILTPITCVSKTLGGLPTAPTISIPSCVNTGVNSFSASITPQPGYTYTWASSNLAWTLMPSGAQGQNLAVSTIGDAPGTITVTVSNGGCADASFTYDIGRTFVSPLAITGLTCVAEGTTNNYTIPGGAITNSSCWTVPTGWGLAYANGAHSSINLTIPINTPAGAYTISVKSCDCPSGVISLVVNVQPRVPSITSGLACVVRNGGSPGVYTSTTSPGATGYQWNYPFGWNCVAGCTATTALLQPGGTLNPPQNLTITAIGYNGCDATSAPLAINYNPITPSGITSSCWNFGVNPAATITVGSAPSPFYGSYTVTSSPAGLANIVSVDPLTGLITLSTAPGTPAGTYTLSITHTTANCGNSTPTTFPVSYAGNGAMIISSLNPTSSDFFTVSSAPSGATFQWYLDGVPVSPNGTNNFLVLANPNPPFPLQVCVDVFSGACATRLCTPGGNHSKMAVVSGDDHTITTENGVKVYPNPTTGDFTLKVPQFEKEANLQIIDVTGKVVATESLQAGENRISGHRLAPGTYLLLVELDGEFSPHRLEVSQK